jgi:rhodanese-related sulfurtransferase
VAQFAAKALTLLSVATVTLALSSVLSAEALAKVEALAEEEQAIRNVPRVTIDELKALMSQNAVLILDVRDPDSFAKGRIPGAVNVDYTQVLKQAEKFAGEKRTIVAYCACANEMTAARASVDLAAKGIPGAKALKGGWDEWVQRGEKIEK